MERNWVNPTTTHAPDRDGPESASYTKERTEGGPRFWCERPGENVAPAAVAHRIAAWLAGGAKIDSEKTAAIATGLLVVTSEPGK